MMMMMMIASIFPPCHDYKGWECVIIRPSDSDDDENNVPDTCKLSTQSLPRRTARSSSRFRWNFSEASSTHRWSMIIDDAFLSILSFQVGISNPLYIDRHLWQPWCSQGLRKRANVNAAEDWGKEVSSPCSSQDQEEQKRTQPTNCEGWDFFKSKCFVHCPSPNMPTYTCDGLDNIFMGVTNLN